MAAETLKPRVEKLEDKVGEHHQVLYGPDGNPDLGLIRIVRNNTNQLIEIQKLIAKQTTYNTIVTWIAGIVGSALILYILEIVLR